ncbi:pentatricopeptide repeat-containing protein At4g39530-like [Zingiber officinale]|uniref:pentatricopeptide repeat-containing protein At4g39530-like n=1 Tax=Zingiber officinale TaxID=94328 RepID=UPI001C4BF3EF|nr:pentatricopeptide repeat-containing protein At4g39530-like [Zingiber officinale]XP_042460933.1 pentatricopeptide repeat-containing protein At4g39530-like [Zingiber officinale]
MSTSRVALPRECSSRSYSQMLQAFTSSRSLTHGKAIHGRLMRSGFDADAYLWNCLLRLYSQCGCLEAARSLFDEMPHRDDVSWTTLMSAYACTDRAEESFRLFCEMLTDGARPNAFALASCLKSCSVGGDLDFGQQLHGVVVKMQPFCDLFVGSSLVDLYAKCERMDLAEKVFFNLPEKDAFCWTTILGGYISVGENMTAFKIFCQLMQTGETISEFTLPTVIKCCGGLDDVRRGLSVHCFVIKSGLEQDGFLSSSLVDMYSKYGLAMEAHKVFIRTIDPDIVVWSAIISCFTQLGLSTEAVELFRIMERVGAKANHRTLASVASAASELGDLALCASLHAYILKNGFETRIEVGNAILNMYMKNGAVGDGCVMFDTMSDHDTVSWNCLLSGFHSGNSCDKGLRIFRNMLTKNIAPNSYTYISVLRSCTSLRDSGCGSQVHAHILKNDLAGDSFIGRAMVDMYASSGNLENASLIFSRLIERDVFSCTLIITGYTNTDQGEKAIDIFRQMLREGIQPNEFTISSCLRACSDLATLASGRQFHAHVIKRGLIGSYVSCNLVDMYSKSGCLMDAESAFSESTSHDLVSWNALICGYSLHGYVWKAIESFKQMIEEGERPDGVTFIGVLSACSHAGLLNEGMMYFDSMHHIYGITPTIEHQRCLIDILGKASKFDEVEQCINQMGLSSDALVWQTVLGACRTHGNVEFAEKVANKLCKLDPSMDSNYILMSNIYAVAGRWTDVTRTRQTMASRGVKKEPGCSWIEVNDQIHVFLSQDHPD